MRKNLCAPVVTRHDGREPAVASGDGPQSPHQSLKDSLLLVVIAVADTHLPAVTPDLGGQKWRAPGSRGSVHEVYDSKRPRSVDLGFCSVKTLGFRRRGLFGSLESTLISQAIPRQTPGFLALSYLILAAE